jgi:hypothetical protein
LLEAVFCLKTVRFKEPRRKWGKSCKFYVTV